MGKTFVCSLCRNGIIGGGLYIDEQSITYSTQKLLISGPRVRVPGGAPDFERQIVRFGVLFYVGKRLHTFCTPFAHLPKSGAFLRKVCTACFPLHKKKKF